MWGRSKENVGKKQGECGEEARRMWGRSKENVRKKGECVGKKGQGSSD